MLRLLVANSIDSHIEVVLLGTLAMVSDEGSITTFTPTSGRVNVQIDKADVSLLLRALNFFKEADTSEGLVLDFKAVESPMESEPDSFEDGDSTVYDVEGQ